MITVSITLETQASVPNVVQWLGESLGDTADVDVRSIVVEAVES